MKLEIGKVYESVQGSFTKITKLKAGFVYFNGWHLKKTAAEKKENNGGVPPINERAFLRVIGESPTATKTVEAPKLSDAVQKLVDDNGIDAATLVGTGKDGAVVVGDVKAAIKARDAAIAELVDFTVTDETLEELNEHLPDGAEALKVGDVVKLDPEHELLKN